MKLKDNERGKKDYFNIKYLFALITVDISYTEVI